MSGRKSTPDGFAWGAFMLLGMVCLCLRWGAQLAYPELVVQLENMAIAALICAGVAVLIVVVTKKGRGACRLTETPPQPAVATLSLSTDPLGLNTK